ncbi:hypothetical protein, partial [Serratia rhizosphaerae]
FVASLMITDDYGNPAPTSVVMGGGVSTYWVRGVYGVPQSGVTVDFKITGAAEPASKSAVTNSDGIARVDFYPRGNGTMIVEGYVNGKLLDTMEVEIRH